MRVERRQLRPAEAILETMKITAQRLKLLFLMAFGLMVPIAFANSAGPSPGYTGAPGENSCRECHTTAALNDGVGSVTIAGVPEQYDAGATYTITVRVNRQDRSRWGFQLTALTSSLDPAGTFALVNTQQTQIKTEGGRQYVEHRTPGTFAGTSGGATWTVQWTAPDTSAGIVAFYAAGNAANNNNANTGDNVYTAFVESAPIETTEPFLDVTATSGLAGQPGGTGVAWADFDRDGDDDFFVMRDGRDLLFRNASGVFSEIGESVGLLATDDSRSASWGDADGDGRPDLFVATTTGARLYLNTGAGFADASTSLGITSGVSAGAWVDIDADGALDLVVCADSELAVLINDGTGEFSDETAAMGLGGVAAPSAVACADFDDDGLVDFVVTTGAGARLFRQGAPSSFTDVTSSAGVSGLTDIRDIAWADGDGDGSLDLFVATGAGVRLLRSDGDGTFTDMTASFGLAGIDGDAVALEDASGDGRIDLLALDSAGLTLSRFNSAVFVDATTGIGIDAGGSTAAWADADGDDRVDLLIVSASGLSMWRNPGTAATLTVQTFTDGDRDASDANTSDDRDAIGATVMVDEDAFFPSGTKQVRVISGGGGKAQSPSRIHLLRPTSAAAAVRVRFAGGKGREVSAAATSVDVRDPKAPAITSISAKLKDGVNKLLVNGSGFLVDVERIEIEDERMDVVKYPKKKHVGDGTTTRLTGEDTSFGALIPSGKPVRVVAINPTTGIFSAPLIFVR
ncbi:MAG: VCBS repeat-containing protein [Blastocatellia bacterium]|nr:VCBS repeat-containing protein [Blastocatellia bacterium]